MEQSNQPGSQPPPCPVCGVDGSRRTWREVTGRGARLLVESRTHPVLGAVVQALVCTNCGNVLFFVDPQRL